MGKHERRLQALERAAAPVLLGYRCFRQSNTDLELFEDEQGQTFTLEEIDTLSAAGWQCIVTAWAMPPEAKQVIRLTWGEGEPAR